VGLILLMLQCENHFANVTVWESEVNCMGITLGPLAANKKQFPNVTVWGSFPNVTVWESEVNCVGITLGSR